METAIWVLVFVSVCNLIITWIGVTDQRRHLSALQEKLIELQNHLADINTSTRNHWLLKTTGKDNFTDEPADWESKDA